MADGTHIEWTDATWNVITGCSVVSPGCTNCYAMKLAGTRLRHHPTRAGLTTDSKAGPVWNGQTRVNWEWIDQPISWRRPRMIFVCAHGDLFHDTVARDDIAQIYGVMIAAHHLRGHILQVLTKRSARMKALLNDPDFWEIANAHAGALILEHVDPLDRRSDDARATCDEYGPRNPPPGIWVGVSVEDQARADERIPDLLATPAAVRWLSMEPLLAPVDLTSIKAPGDEDETDGLNWRFDALEVGDYYWFEGENGQPGDCGDGPYRDHRIDWVVLGGESGQGSRPVHPDWVRNVREQCANATIHGDPAPVPFFFKQWGAWAPDPNGDRCVAIDSLNMPNLEPSGSNGDGAVRISKVGKKAAGRLLDGVQHDGMPEVRA